MRKKFVAIFGLTSCILLMVSCTNPTVDSVNEKLNVRETIDEESFEIPTPSAEDELTLDSTYLEEIQVYQKRTICYHNALYTFFDDAIHQVKDDSITRVFECQDAVGRIREGYLYWATLTEDNQVHIIRFDENGNLLEVGQIAEGKSLSGIDFYQDTLYVRYSIGSVEAYQLDETGIITGMEKEDAVSLYKDENRAAKIRIENPTDMKSILDIQYNSLIDIRNYNQDSPCKSIYLMEDISKNPINSIFVLLWNDETRIFQLPIQDNFLLSLDRVEFADIDGDGSDEIIISCWFGAYFYGLYLLDLDTNKLFDMPILSDTDNIVGVDYELKKSENEGLVIMNDSINYYEIIDLQQIITNNYKVMESTNTMLTEKEYRDRYKYDVGFINFWSEFRIGICDGRECLILKQPICGVWGKNDILGFMETTIIWDQQGKYELLYGKYYDKPE